MTEVAVVPGSFFISQQSLICFSHAMFCTNTQLENLSVQTIVYLILTNLLSNTHKNGLED